MIDILTFNDLAEIGENEKDRMEFVMDVIRESIKSTINAIPPFDVAPVVKGRWVSKNTHCYDWVFVCSNCGYIDGYHFNDRHNFCPKCGAKMEQEDF